MNIIKYKKERVMVVFNGGYILLCWVICMGVFGSSLVGVETGYSLWLLGLIIPSMIGWILMISLYTDKGDDRMVLDKSLDVKNKLHLLMNDKPTANVTYYYPAINMSIAPIIGLQAFLSSPVISFVVPFMICFLVISKNMGLTVGLVLVAISMMWVSFAAINTMTALKILAARKQGQLSTKFVSMNFSYQELENICKDQEIFYYVDSDKNVDMLRYIARKGVIAAQVANNLIQSGDTDAEALVSEVAVIEHIINSFVVTTINTSNNFFKKHRGKKEAAEKIYLRDVAPQIRKEALELKDKIEAITSTLNNIAVAGNRARIKADEDSISIDAELLLMTESAVLPIPQFPEYHSLTFKNNQNKVAAKNIVGGSLMTLVRAKDLARDDIEQEKIEQQINTTKDFVKALACGTPESEAREARLMEASKQDALFLGGANNDITAIDNIIAIEQRYINSYDSTLPFGNKE